MGKSRIQDGWLYEISLLPFDDVYVLAKVLDYTKFEREVACPLVLKVYNKTQKTRFDGRTSHADLILMCNPLRFFTSAGTAPDSWRKVARVHTAKEEYKQLNLRLHWPINVTCETEVQEARWFYVSDSDTTSMSNPVNYDTVRHLETTWETYIECIPLRIFFELCKLKRLDIRNFLVSEDNRNTYLSCFDIPPYLDIPDNFRNEICHAGISNVVRI